jgi:hypothetical protein
MGVFDRSQNAQPDERCSNSKAVGKNGKTDGFAFVPHTCRASARQLGRRTGSEVPTLPFRKRGDAGSDRERIWHARRLFCGFALNLPQMLCA